MARGLESRLLAAMKRELKRLKAIDVFKLGGDRFRVGQIRAAVRNAGDGIIEMDFPGLMGKALSDAEVRACQRAAVRLEGRGLIRRLCLGSSGTRTTHLQLVETAAGE